MKPRHRAVLKWSLLVLGWAVLLGLIAPALISQPDTFAVVLGAGLLLAYTYVTYVLLDNALAKETVVPPPAPSTPPKEKQ